MNYSIIKDQHGTYYYYKCKNEKKATIIFIHGFATTSEYHDEFIKHIIDEYDYIAIQLPGAGIQEWNSKKKPLVEDMVDYAVNLIKHINIEQFILIGHSMGGGIAARVANILRDKVICLILSTPMNSRISKLSIFNYFKFNPKTFKKSHRLTNILYHDISSLYNHDQDKIHKIINDDLEYQIANYTFMKNLKKSMFSIKNLKIGRKHEMEITTPTLVIAGKHDVIIPAKSLYKAFNNKKQREKGNIKVETMQFSAHLPFKEQEIEYAKEIKDFINYVLNSK